MAIVNKITPKEAARINAGLRKTKDSNHSIRHSGDGEAFWDVAFSGFDAIDASGSRDLMYEA